jgi:uncharacterized membrane protein YphA (DoxX/SURF4 family)
MVTTTHTAQPVSTRTGTALPVRILSWALRILLAAFFLNAARPKLAADDMMIAAFAERGGSPMMYFVGSLEVAGAIGLLIPILSGFAAIGLAALLAIFAIVEISTTGPATAMMSTGTLILTLGVVYLQRKQAVRLFGFLTGLLSR